MPKIENEKTAKKLERTVRSYNRIRYRIINQVKSAESIVVPKSLEGCEWQNRVETYKTMLTNETYVKAQLKTEEGKDNILFLLHSIESAMGNLRKLIRQKEEQETEFE